MWRRCDLCVMATMFTTLLTGCQSQCITDFIRPQRLKANPLISSNIFSPGYPGDYPDRAECEWKLYTDPGYVIHLHVVWLDVEQSTDCHFDFITLFDGHTDHHPEIAKICTEHRVDFYSSSNYMYVQFISDFSIHSDGFRLVYTAVNAWQVPSTTTTEPPWWLTSHPPTTTAATDNWQDHINTAALIGGFSGGLLVLIIFCALCRYYYSRAFSSRQTARPYYPSHVPPSAPAASTIYQNNNSAVFMLSGSSVSSYGGRTNMGFSPCGEAPPAYFTVQQSGATVMQPENGAAAFMGAGPCPPPPSYTEAMRISHPPALAPVASLTVLPVPAWPAPPPPPPPPPPEPAPPMAGIVSARPEQAQPPSDPASPPS